jgi:nitroreductase
MLRRSDRSFLTKSVDNETLKKLAPAVNWAASSCNKQPIVLFATTNPEIAKACLKCCKGGTGFSDFIPAFISFTADMRGYYLPDEAYLPSIDVALGAQNFFLAAKTMGLSGCCLSWALKDQKEDAQLRKLLAIPDFAQIIFNVVIGYPSKSSVTPARKNLSETLFIR